MGFLVFNVIGPVLTVGIPVFLFLRYGLLSPLSIFVLELGFWLLISIVAVEGDAPAYYLALAAWFVYIPLYALFAGAEWIFRARGILPQLPSG